MALGWGLWEGPARFLFWLTPVKFVRSFACADFIATLTFERSGIIYGTDDQRFGRLPEYNDAASHPSVSASPQSALS